MQQNWLVCRVCLTHQKNQMHCIFDKDDKKDLTKKLFECGGVPIKRFDHFPDKICSRCLKVLNAAWKLRLNCQRSFKELSRFMAPVVVDENVEKNSAQQEETATIEDSEDNGIYQDLQLDEQYEEDNSEGQEFQQEIELEDQQEAEEDFPTEDEQEEMSEYGPVGGLESEIIGTEPQALDIPQVKQEYSDPDDVVEIYSPMEEEIEPVDEAESIEFSDAEGQARANTESTTEYIRDGEDDPVTDEEYLHIEESIREQPAPKRKYERHLIRERKTPGRKPGSLNKMKTEVLKRGPKPKKEKKTAYICDMCGNIYPSQGRLTEHLKLHMGIKPHECEICQHRFAQTQQLARHMNTHTGNRPYKCDYCPAAFADLSTRNKHHRIHTNERPYVCDVCGKAFTYTNTLKFHKMIHTGEKPFVCDICGKGFQQAYKLRNHKYTHARKGVQVKTEVEEVEVETYVLDDPYQDVGAVINAPAQILEI